ncbi:MAG: hypothetical protein AB7K37_03170 [Cyclobacteriaceae bacterium]
MITWKDFSELSKEQKINRLYREGSFVVSIRYYSHKVNLYLLGSFYVEVFYNPRRDCVEKITRLDTSHTRMKFYFDQIKLPKELAA